MARISGILKWAIVLLVADSTVVNFRVFTYRCVSSVARSFEAFELVPDVVPKAPNTLALVSYRSGVSAKKGNELTPTEVKDQPTVTWIADPGKFYTVACIDPDVPSRKEPSQREFQHWLVGNVPGNDVDAGEVLTAYIGSGPEKYTGLHRYTYLVYKQPNKIVFDEQRINDTSQENRSNFAIAKFAKKYNFGDPIAGNFYLAKYDDYVPIVHIQLNDPNYV